MLTSSTAPSGRIPAQPEATADAEVRTAIEALDAEWHDEAVVACERALAIDPGCAAAFFVLGLVSYDLDEPVHALKLLTKAHELEPDVLEFAEGLAAVLARIGKVGEALFYAKLATTLSPHRTIRRLLPGRLGTFFKNLEKGDTRPYLGRAERYLLVGDLAEVAEDCRRQLELTPGDPTALRLLAQTSYHLGRVEQSAVAFKAVLHAGPPRAEDLSGLARTLSISGQHEAAASCHAAARDLAPDDPELHSRHLADLVGSGRGSAADLVAAHRAWAARHCMAVRPHRWAPAARDPDRPLRVAHISGAFYHNDFVELYAPILKAHRAGRVQICCYYDGRRRDTATESLVRAAHKWTDITGIDDETLWQILRGDAIDVAVDLSGHYEGGRVLAFARRLAPVTVSWLGYPYPPAVAELDYFVTDPAACPSAEIYPNDGPRIRHLPRPALAYRPPGLLPDTEPLPALRTGHVTLGVSCSLGDVTTRQVRLWAALMWRLADARLLVCNRFDQDMPCIERCLDLLSNFGLRQRVDVLNMADNFRSEFDFYQHVDLALDPGTPGSRTETCRALWMGVPVVGLAGEHCAARQGASVLAAAGCSDWIAHDRGEFVEIAAGLAADLDRLAELRAGLRARVARSALADVAGLARSLEETYLRMWDERARRAEDC